MKLRSLLPAILRSPRSVLERRRAQEEYFAASERAGAALEHLRRYGHTPKTRSLVLSDLVVDSFAMAAAAEIFDNDWTCSDGFTPAQWERSCAAIYHLVAATEDLLTDDGEEDLRITVLQAQLLAHNAPVELVLESLSEAADVETRARLLLDLYAAVLPEVGGQAAECLASLAFCYFVAAGRTTRDAMALVWSQP